VEEAPAKPPRRTQAERRAATRTALLDAVLQLLVEDGYANLTTRRIASSAGVSQGAQQHYFRTKSEFVLEAMRHAIDKIAQDALHRIDLTGLEDPGKQEALLDEIWAIHQSPAFKAALELWIASRTDAELRRTLRTLERGVSETLRQSARAAMSDVFNGSASPDLLELFNLVLAAVRGIAMLAPVVPQAELELRWQAAKPAVLALWQQRLSVGP
jgi:AcrR family transcriptional regulator